MATALDSERENHFHSFIAAELQSLRQTDGRRNDGSITSASATSETETKAFDDALSTARQFAEVKSKEAETARQELSDVAAQNATLQSELTNTKKELVLAKELSAKGVADLQEVIVRREGEIEELRRGLHHVEQNAANERSAFGSAQRLRDATFESASAEVNELQSQVATKDSTIASLTAEVQEVRIALDAERHTSQDLQAHHEAEVAALRDALNEVKAQQEVVVSELSTKIQEISRMRQTIDGHRAEREQQRLSASPPTLRAVEEQVANLDEQGGLSCSERGNGLPDRATVCRFWAEGHSEIKALRKQLSNAQQSLAQGDQERAEVVEMRRTRAQLVASLGALQTEVERIRDENKDLRIVIAGKEGENAELERYLAKCLAAEMDPSAVKHCSSLFRESAERTAAASASVAIDEAAAKKALHEIQALRHEVSSLLAEKETLEERIAARRKTLALSAFADGHQQQNTANDLDAAAPFAHRQSSSLFQAVLAAFDDPKRVQEFVDMAAENRSLKNSISDLTLKVAESSKRIADLTDALQQEQSQRASELSQHEANLATVQQGLESVSALLDDERAAHRRTKKTLGQLRLFSSSVESLAIVLAQNLSLLTSVSEEQKRALLEAKNKIRLLSDTEGSEAEQRLQAQLKDLHEAQISEALASHERMMQCALAQRSAADDARVHEAVQGLAAELLDRRRQQEDESRRMETLRSEQEAAVMAAKEQTAWAKRLDDALKEVDSANARLSNDMSSAATVWAQVLGSSATRAASVGKSGAVAKAQTALSGK